MTADKKDFILKQLSLTEFKDLLFDINIGIVELEEVTGEPVGDSITYWRKKELVPFIPPGKHIYKLRLSDVVWLKMVKLLQEFGYSIDDISKVSDYFFTDAYYDEVPKTNFLNNQQLLQEKESKGTITPKEKKTLEFINANLRNKDFMQVLRYNINYLSILISAAIASGEAKAILIFRDGRVAEKHNDVCYTHSSFEVDLAEPHIYIPLGFLLRDLVKDERLMESFGPYAAKLKRIVASEKTKHSPIKNQTRK